MQLGGNTDSSIERAALVLLEVWFALLILAGECPRHREISNSHPCCNVVGCGEGSSCGKFEWCWAEPNRTLGEGVGIAELEQELSSEGG